LFIENKKVPFNERIIIRSGIHSGTGSSFIDINQKLNISGTVVNTTQRAMDFGGPWHILATKNAYDEIGTLNNNIKGLFHEIGIGTAKHKEDIVLYNIYDDNGSYGNRNTPNEIQDISSTAETSSVSYSSNYFVNKNAQLNGDHEVHTSSCAWKPNPENQIALGWHSNCQSAVVEAKKHYSQSNGCAYCSPACHTS